ncbi:UNVERIFIED_CONTAM: hypothetical protein O8I53_09450 [Campylobacter lari]
MQYEYQKGLSIVLNAFEHAFIHYLIVNANTTRPNNGMCTQFEISE